MPTLRLASDLSSPFYRCILRYVLSETPSRFVLFLCLFQIAHIPTNTHYQCDRISCGTTTTIFMPGNYARLSYDSRRYPHPLSSSQTIHQEVVLASFSSKDLAVNEKKAFVVCGDSRH